MVSGLVASQKGLQVTGNNISNINTPGYTRQQVLQHDSPYMNIDKSKQVGLGVSVTEIRQIRDSVADRRIRTENSVLSYYGVKQEATQEIESILGEPNGENLSKLLNDFWKQAQKLATNPSGVEERLAFLQTADVLVKKANHITESLGQYQEHLNNEVKQGVNRVNTILYGIRDYNEAIANLELNGDNANSLRDERNLLLDELSQYVEIDYYETKDGKVVVKAEGREVVDGKFVVELDLKQTAPGSAFVKPVWKDTGDDVFRMDKEINGIKENDTGRLKSLLAVRGNFKADGDTSWDDIALNTNKSVSELGNAYMLPKLQKELASFMNELTKMVNETLDGYGMGEYADEQGVPVFITDQSGNIHVNPELLADGGYNKLGTITEIGNVGDNSKVTELLEEWSKPRAWPITTTGSKTEPHGKLTNFTDFYAEFVAELGREGFEAKGKVKEKTTLVTNIENQRLSMSGVSQDEELANVLKFQYAYNASARMITVLDGMMDIVINKL